MKITKKQQARMTKIAKEYEIKLLILFGSFANGKNTAQSDLDIAIQLKNEEISFKKFLRLITKLSEIFKKDVDLSLINRANPLLLKQISQGGKLLFGNRRDFAAFKILSFHRYNDYLPFFKLEEAANKKHLNLYAAR